MPGSHCQAVPSAALRTQGIFLKDSWGGQRGPLPPESSPQFYTHYSPGCLRLARLWPHLSGAPKLCPNALKEAQPSLPTTEGKAHSERGGPEKGRKRRKTGVKEMMGGEGKKDENKERSRDGGEGGR